ncbi:unnamed protein product [Schistosoma curassoni]|uniref:MYND-type domain-containing protein n=1 Tax=Schistosoma curassoni TaxID=6186 RepID=A0A183KD03_9TREM|nr:unnamed protein product [Schistosoma curassoni]
MNHTVNTTQVICNTTSHSINTIPSTNVNITTNEKIDNTIKSNRIPSTNDVYREPVLTRVAASLRNSPIITSESTTSSSSTVLQTLCQPMISVNPMKRKYNDTSSSSTITMELESISSEDIHDTIDYNKKKRKKSKHHHLKKITLKPLLTEHKTTTIITNLANNDEINSKDDNNNNNNNNNNNMSNDNTVVIEENSLPIENDSEPIVPLTIDEIQCVSDSMIPSTSNTSDNVHTILDDFRNSVNEALRKLQEQLAPTINATDNIGVYPLTNSELPNLHPICCDVAIQTNNDIHLLDDSKSLKTINVINDTKSVQTDIMEVSTDLSILNDYRPPTLQERMMEAEILRMEQEVQRLNVLVRYTRAEMGLEMQRRIGELRRIWNDELIAIMEAASRIWEYDVIRIVDIVKRRQWCAYCGRIAYYYCCWNTSYCNSTCQSKHWPFHMTSCVQVKSQLNNNKKNKNNLNGSIRHHSQSPNITNSSNITDQQPHFSLTQPSILQHIPQNPPPHHHHHHQQQQQQRMILPNTSNPSVGMYRLNNDGTLLTTSNTLFQRSLSSSCVLPSQPFKN